MRYTDKLLKIGAGALLLGFIIALFAALSPFFMLKQAADASQIEWFMSLRQALAMSAFILFLFGGTILYVYSFVLVLTAKNNNTWKIFWLLLFLLFGIFGFLAYYIFGNKERIE